MWRKTVGAIPIAQLESDRIAGIRVALGEGVGSVLSVIGVYLMIKAWMCIDSIWWSWSRSFQTLCC